MLSLSEAIKAADPQQVEQLIQEGINVNALCSNGKTPLALAVEQLLGYPSSLEGGRIVEKLLAAGAQIDSVDAKQQILLHQLCKSISSSCIKHPFFRFNNDETSVNIDQESQLRSIKSLLSYRLPLNNYDANGTYAFILRVAKWPSGIGNLAHGCRCCIRNQPAAWSAGSLATRSH